MQNTDLTHIANRAKHRHGIDEASRLERQQAARVEAERTARNLQQEREIAGLLDAVITDLNAHFPEPLVRMIETSHGREYHFSNRTLTLHFFRQGALYDSPLVPGRMETLHRGHVVHGGYIEIREGGKDRQGWNLLLLSPEENVGEWRIVETRVSAFTGRVARFEPFATEAQLLADNVACHWSPAMHVYTLTDKPLERNDLVKILNIFVPS